MKIFWKRERKKKFEDREEETQKDRGMEKKDKGHEDRYIEREMEKKNKGHEDT